MDAKYKDLHIVCNGSYYQPGKVIRGVEISLIEFKEKFVTIIYYENNIRYEMSIPYTELERKSIVID